MKNVCGIYSYRDLKEDKIIYIGQSKNIYKRHRQHFAKSAYNSQPINRILQNDPVRYILEIQERCSPSELNNLEKKYIKEIKPQFNFTLGGNFVPKHNKHKDNLCFLWSTEKCHYISHVNQKRNKPFRLYYYGWYVPCGYFTTWIELEMIWNIIKEEDD